MSENKRKVLSKLTELFQKRAAHEEWAELTPKQKKAVKAEKSDKLSDIVSDVIKEK